MMIMLSPNLLEFVEFSVSRRNPEGIVRICKFILDIMVSFGKTLLCPLIPSMFNHKQGADQHLFLQPEDFINFTCIIFYVIKSSIKSIVFLLRSYLYLLHTRYRDIM